MDISKLLTGGPHLVEGPPLATWLLFNHGRIHSLSHSVPWFFWEMFIWPWRMGNLIWLQQLAKAVSRNMVISPDHTVFWPLATGRASTHHGQPHETAQTPIIGLGLPRFSGSCWFPADQYAVCFLKRGLSHESHNFLQRWASVKGYILSFLSGSRIFPQLFFGSRWMPLVIAGSRIPDMWFSWPRLPASDIATQPIGIDHLQLFGMFTDFTDPMFDHLLGWADMMVSQHSSNKNDYD